MAAAHGGDDLARSVSQRLSFSASSRKWASASIREAFSGAPGGDAFERLGQQDDEDELKWAAIERLPTYERSRREMLEQVTADNAVMVTFGHQDKKELMESVLRVVEEDNESFLRCLRERIDR